MLRKLNAADIAGIRALVTLLDQALDERGRA
jgi:hypothetical protein